jgi:acyl-CoA synthetase (AMP-forming)/AMP-acid ligase II
MPFSVMVALTPDAAAAVPLPGIATDLAMLVYTSGSTGVPKGVAMAHQNVVAAATLIAGYLEMLESDVVLCALPLSHNYGLYQLMTATKVGATVVLEKSFAFPMAVLERAERFQVTTIPLVPTMVSMLLQMKDLQPGRVPSLRCLTNAAAPLAPAHVARLQELFPAARLYCMYGLTECVRGTYLPPEDVQTRPGSVGHAIPGTEAWLVDENGSRVEAGEVGELVIRGPHVMCGYWNKPSETEKVLRSGAQPWEKLLYTGDLFRADSEGYLYFVSRKDHMIKSRGEKVSPNEVESVLFALPGVREAAVVGMPHPVFGTLLHAIVVLEPGAELTKRQILRHCSERLEDFMVPAEIEFRTELPKSENGKLLRHLLVAQHQEAAE